jgi:ABC-type bacteriocin/lantibiotic exporter with double-glycine peptidase domain
MLKHLLSVKHRPQTRQADCLAACVSMVLDYLGRPMSYEDLIDLLQIGPIGAPRRNVPRLLRLGLVVTYGEASLSLLAAHLRADRPVIACVDTGELPYWSTSTNHAVVIVGLDAQDVFLPDPAFEADVQVVPRGDFELAWLECDNLYTMITLPEPE